MRLQVYAILAPIDRLLDAPAWGRVVGFTAACVSYLITDVFTTALILIIVSGSMDYVLGVHTARRRRAYDPEVAHAGAVSKVTGVALMLLVRMAEHWLMRQGIVDTRGMLAAALTISLFAVDLESIQDKRVELGGRPIPALGVITRLMHGIIERFTGPVSHPSRRRDDGGSVQ